MGLFFALIVCLALVLLPCAVGSADIIRDQVEVYRKIMEAKGIKEFNASTMIEIYRLHDLDANCGVVCQKYLNNLIGSSDWEFFYKLISTIYEGQISFDPYTPQEIHLALTPDPTAMKVMWASMANLENPFCQYLPTAVTDWSQARSVSATNYTYRVPEKWWPIFTGVLYETDMTNLVPEASYTYRVGGWDSANQTTRYSEPFTFHASPTPTRPNRHTRSVFMADHGTFELLGFAVVRKLQAMQAELGFEHTMLGGDLSYAGLSSAMPLLNIDKEDEFERVWDLLGIQNQPVAATVPWMVALGNHERFYDWAALTNRYRMPASKNSNGNFWYSYDYGNVHWIGISSEHSLDAGSEQITFFEQDLIAANANRHNVPWIMVVLHKPLYCSDDSTPDGYAAKLEALCIQYDVDMTLTGHMHAYERVHPVKSGEVTVFPEKKWLASPSTSSGSSSNDVPRRVDVYHATGFGPVHVVQGNSGAMQFERWQQPAPTWSAKRMANGYVVPNITRTRESSDPFEASQLEITAGLDGLLLDKLNYTDTFGFGFLNFLNGTHLHYSSIPITGEIGRDEFWLVKRI